MSGRKLVAIFFGLLAVVVTLTLLLGDRWGRIPEPGQAPVSMPAKP